MRSEIRKIRKFSLRKERENALFFLIDGTMKFRPCIDIHQGKVKQIVGSTLKDDPTNKGKDNFKDLQTNFETEKSSVEFATLYKSNNI